MLIMGKLSATWGSANNHCEALGKSVLPPGPYFHLKLTGWTSTWRFSNVEFLQELQQWLKKKKKTERGRTLGLAIRTSAKLYSFSMWGNCLALRAWRGMWREIAHLYVRDQNMPPQNMMSKGCRTSHPKLCRFSILIILS